VWGYSTSGRIQVVSSRARRRCCSSAGLCCAHMHGSTERGSVAAHLAGAEDGLAGERLGATGLASTKGVESGARHGRHLGRERVARHGRKGRRDLTSGRSGLGRGKSTCLPLLAGRRNSRVGAKRLREKPPRSFAFGSASGFWRPESPQKLNQTGAISLVEVYLHCIIVSQIRRCATYMYCYAYYACYNQIL
jgi:hypothetical protein